MKASAQAAQAGFVWRTALAPGECRVNFRQIDNDAIAAVTSDEASAVTPLMSKIYLRLIQAPAALWERPGVLRFTSDLGEAELAGAWRQLVTLVGVAPAKESGSEEILEHKVPPAPSRAREDEWPLKPGRDALDSPSGPPAAPDRELAVWKEELKDLIAGLCDRELARTRERLERAGLPKATRVAMP